MMLVSSNTHAEWGDLLKFFAEDNADTGQSLLTEPEIIDGLKAALSKGTKIAIGKLGKTDGFYGQPRFRIPMPDALQTAEKSLRKLGQDKIADDFILTMNRAAERAVPEAATIFSDAISNMSFADARKILNGPDDAATSYLRETGGKELEKSILPIVQQATAQVGITAKYKELVEKLGFMANLIDNDSLDIDQYVTNKSIDALFSILADEEKLIRANPAARTSDLLQRVFSSQS